MTAIFVIIVYYASAQMMLDFKPKAHRQMPGDAGRFVAGGIIGIISSLVAAGGGFLSVPFMLFCNVAVHQAVGTSAALGFPIAVAGAIGYVVSGWSDTGLPQYTFGYIYLPAFFGIVVMSITLAPFGAKLAHRLPVKKLKRMFGAFLALLATKMLFSLIG